MDRLFFREKADVENFDNEIALDNQKEKRRIITGVIPISRGAGATFTATSLAFLLSKIDERDRKKSEIDIAFPKGCVCYVEGSLPADGCKKVFYEASLDKKLKWGRFTDFFDINNRGEQLSERVNLYKGINWVVYGPKSKDSVLPLDELVGDYMIVDNPGPEYFQKCDLLIGVIDPLPAAIFAGAEKYEIIKNLEESGKRVIWVVNKDNNCVNHGELKRFLNLKKYFSIPLFDAAIFYESQYNCILPAESKKFLPSAKKAFDEILCEITEMTYFTI